MDAGTGINHRDAEAFLRSHLSTEIAEFRRLQGGEWSTAYSMIVDGSALVARFSSVEEDFTKDAAAFGFASTHLPVPRLVAMGEALGGYFAISEYAAGRPLDSLTGAEIVAALPSVLLTLDVIRNVPIVEDSGFGSWGAGRRAPFSSWSEFLMAVKNGPAPTSRTEGWRERLDDSATGSGPFDRAYRRLQEIAPALPRVRHLVHADLLSGNLLVSDGQISAVLDWGNALHGDFLYDLAWFHFWEPWYPAWSGLDFVQEARRHYRDVGLDVPDFDRRLTACLIHIGLDGQAYSAFKERWDEVDRTSRRTLEFAI